jgi:hypothetical protein
MGNCKQKIYLLFRSLDAYKTEGQQMAIWKDDKSIFQGFKDKDDLYTIGRKVDDKGGVYSGRLKNNKPHDLGTYTNDDFEYNGKWVDGLKEGDGVETDLTTNEVYRGTFLNGKRHGPGSIS